MSKSTSFIVVICACLHLAASTYGVEAKSKEVGTGEDATISCVVSGLTTTLDGVKWTTSVGTDVTTISGSNYAVVDGTLSGNTQTTTLSVKGAANTADSTYSCLITSTEHVKTDDPTTVTLNVFTVTPNDKSVTTAVDQVISCGITELSAAATVTWIEPGGADILDSDTTNYVVDQGSYSAGSQTTTLTIKPTKLKTLTSPATYKCSVTSGMYSDSPPSQKDVVVTVSYSVKPVNKEVGTGEDGTISCVVSGLTTTLNAVKWTTSDGTDVSTISGSNYAVVDGTLSGNTQTTTLTVKGAANTADSTYSCLITSNEHVKTDDPTTVTLDVFIVTPNDKSVTTAVDQTISCDITKLSAAATVTWIEPGGADILDSDTTNYVVDQGSYSAGSQTTTLTIKPAKLKTLTSPATYKCSVTSGQYSDSPASQKDVVVTVLSYSVTSVSKEVGAGDDATISCVVSGLTKTLDAVKWTKSDGTDVATLTSNYVVDAGTLSGDTQTATLAVKGAANTVDSTYSCLITSTEHAKTDDPTTVTLDVFTVTPNDKSVTTAVDQTISCDITELSAAATVTWIEPGGVDILVSDTTNYVVDQGTGGYSAGSQTTTLTIKPAKLKTLTSPATYKCSVTSGQYSDSPASQKDVVVTVSYDKEESSTNTGAIVGGVFGAVVFIMGAVAVAFIVYKKKFRKAELNYAVNLQERGTVIANTVTS